MNVRPLRDRVLIKRVEAQEQRIGGIIVPDTAKEKPQQAKVIAVGNGRVNDDGKTIPLDVKVGDHVLIGKAKRVAALDEELAARLTPAVLRDIVEAIPPEWLADAGGEPRRADYLTYLTQRLEAPRAFAQEAQRANAGLL